MATSTNSRPRAASSRNPAEDGKYSAAAAAPVPATLSAIERVRLARNPSRPQTLDYVEYLVRDFFEIHGDRRFADDGAIVAGLGYFGRRAAAIVGHQRGRSTQERIRRNFGKPHPEGYRKAARMYDLASRMGLPLITFIDTQGAEPGLGAEERGQAEAIARNLREMAGLRTPLIAVVIGEGGSGGALAIGVGNRVLMLEYAIYSVISPEGCAAILWGDRAKAPEASELMRITAPDMLRLGVVDAVVPEPVGGAHRDWEGAAGGLRAVLRDQLWQLKSKSADDLVRERYEKFRRIGVWQEESLPASQG
jgi:acetyl-CoA carboxylase carboxyl transferase subunit alpha